MAVITVTTQPTPDPQGPTVTFYLQLVSEFMAAIEQMSLIMPKVEESEGATAQNVRTNLGVPYAFCVTAINAVEQLPELAGAKKLHAERARNLLQFIEAFAPLYDQLTAVASRLRHALRAAKSEVGTASLHIYRIAQSVASDRRSPAVEAHVVALKRDLNRKGQTKAEQADRKARKLREDVQKELIRIGIDPALLDKEKEVKKAA